MRVDRQWMNKRLNDDGTINKDFVDSVETFVTFACNHSSMRDVTEIRCPCKKCHNQKYQKLEEVRLHLFRKGFILDYYEWNRHGEPYRSAECEHSEYFVSADVDTEPPNTYRQMILDAAGPEFYTEGMDEEPNSAAQKFFDMLNAVDEQLWDGCNKHSQMLAVAQLLHMKSEHHFSERCYDDFAQFLHEVLLENNKMVDNFYKTKKLVFYKVIQELRDFT